MPFAGTALVAGSVVTSEPLTDKLTIVAVKRDPNDVENVVRPRDDPGGHGSGHGPVQPADPGRPARDARPIGSDAGQRRGRQAVGVRRRRLAGRPVGHRLLGHDHLLVDHAAARAKRSSSTTSGRTSRSTPTPTSRRVLEQTALTGTRNVLVTVKAPQAPDGVTSVGAVITVKSANGLETQDPRRRSTCPPTAPLPHRAPSRSTSPARPTMGRADDPRQRLQPRRPHPAEVRQGGGVAGRRDAGAQRGAALVRDAGIFPQPYRGWGIAGYTAGEGLRTVRMVESAFVIDPDSFPTDEPTRDDASLDDAHTESAYAFIPAVSPGGGTTAEPVGTDRWVGPRANLYADAAVTRTSRLAVDSVDFSNVAALATGGGRSAPTRLGISGPGLTLSFGVGPARRLRRPLAKLRVDRLRGSQRRRLPRRDLHGIGDLHQPGRYLPRPRGQSGGPRSRTRT